MKRHWIEYTEEWTPGPMTCCVHVPSASDPTTLNPPAPASVPGKGYRHMKRQLAISTTRTPKTHCGTFPSRGAQNSFLQFVQKFMLPSFLSCTTN